MDYSTHRSRPGAYRDRRHGDTLRQGHEVYGYQLLGSLLGEGDHTPHFLNRVGSDMLWFEQSYAKENGGDLPWDQVWTDGWGGVEGGHDVVSAVNEGMRLDWSDGYGAKDSA